jgi:hypothetical protein
MSSARKIKCVGLLVVSALVALTLLQVAQAADGTPPANTTVSDVPTSAALPKKYDCTPSGPVCFLISSDAAGKDASGDSALHTNIICGAPQIASYPVLSGTGSPGNTLSLSDGTWRSACSWINIISYDWNGPHGSGNTYAVGDSDVGSTIVGTVTACNDEGCVPAPSNGITITGPSEPPAPPPGPTITLSYSPAQPDTSQATVISLTSNAQRCNTGTLTGGRSWNTSGSANGSFSVGFLPIGDYTAEISCVTSQNVWGSKSVSFTVIAAQPPPPPPPPPPSTADADGDGVADNLDNCGKPGTGLVANQDQLDSDGDGIGNACDPTPFTGEITAGNTVLVSSSDGDFWTAVMNGCPGRLKYATYKQEWKQAGVNLTFLAMEVSYRVCYRYGGTIYWARPAAGVATYKLIPWSWQRANDDAFPSSQNIGTSAIMRWQGSAAICAFHYACGPTVHPWVSVQFYTNNTAVTHAGVG